MSMPYASCQSHVFNVLIEPHSKRVEKKSCFLASCNSKKNVYIEGCDSYMEVIKYLYTHRTSHITAHYLVSGGKFSW